MIFSQHIDAQNIEEHNYLYKILKLYSIVVLNFG